MKKNDNERGIKILVIGLLLVIIGLIWYIIYRNLILAKEKEKIEEYTKVNLEGEIMNKVTFPILYSKNCSKDYYSVEKFLVSRLTEINKMTMAINLIDLDSSMEKIEVYLDDTQTYTYSYSIKPSIIKESYIKLFGDKETYNDESFIMDTVPCAYSFKYMKDLELYHVGIPANCTCTSSDYINEVVYSKNINALENNDYLYVYANVASFGSDSVSKNNLYDCSKKGSCKVISHGTILSEPLETSVDSTKVFNNLVKKESVSTYLYTFKKNGDNYYFYSGDWQN